MRARTISRQTPAEIMKRLQEADEQRPRSTLSRKGVVPFLLIIDSDFGKDAPRWTIASGRRHEPPPPQIPGPGAYEIKPESKFRKTYQFAKSLPRSNPTSLTADIDFYYRPIFPEPKPSLIHEKTNLPLFYPSNTPGPSYTPPSTIKCNGHKILSRTKILHEIEFPPPGSYDPTDYTLPRSPAYSIKGPKHRDDWLLDHMNTPGPGQYTPLSTFGSPPKTAMTFGKRSRKGKRKPMDLENTLVIDKVTVRLENVPDPENCRKYVIKHQSLKALINELFTVILEAKPDKPVEFIQTYFNGNINPPESIEDYEKE